VSGEGGVKVVSKVDSCGVCGERLKANSVFRHVGMVEVRVSYGKVKLYCL
jgi:hypothetical protein